ncbi:MAG: Y-family DNA polymerase [Vicingaceae bacterium]
MFALVDCNNFYASCERLFQPHLHGKPIVVLSNNDGCVIARSNEAKAVGIPMGAPAFQYEETFKERGVHVFSANFPLYGDLSDRVMSILERYCPEIEIYSIDEAFLDLSAFQNQDLKAYAIQMRTSVLKATEIPVSIGIAPTKALAKVANRIAKKFPNKTQNVYLIDSEEKRMKALKWLKVEDIWGIGRRLSLRLKAIGVNTAYEFCMLNHRWVQQNLSIVGYRLQRDLLGKSSIQMEVPQLKRNIAVTRSFEKDYSTYEELKERIVTFAVTCAERLRKQKSCCNSLSVFIRSNKHRSGAKQHNSQIHIDLPFATNSNIELAKFATLALNRIFKKGYRYKKAGVIVHDFCPEVNLQQKLFDNRDNRHLPLMNVIDELNKHYGPQKIKLASQDPKRQWKMNQLKLSKAYTTKVSEVIRLLI